MALHLASQLCSHFFIIQKLQERQATVNKSAMPQKEKGKWRNMLVTEMMSSEESNLDNEDVTTVKPLPWHAECLLFFTVWTAKWRWRSQAKRQHKRRVESSECSLRSKPVGIALLDWSVVKIKKLKCIRLCLIGTCFSWLDCCVTIVLEHSFLCCWICMNYILFCIDLILFYHFLQKFQQWKCMVE